MDKQILRKINKGEVCAIIPARSGSKGIPHKNIKLMCGYPLISYTIAAAKLSETIDRTIVSTDSREYAEIAKLYGAQVPFLRPADISNDSSTDLELMAHAIQWLYDQENSVPEYFVHLRVTCPIRETSVIDQAVALMKQHPEATSLLSACIPEGILTPFKWLVKQDDIYFKSIFFENNDDANRPRQSYPSAYMRSVYVDIISVESLVKNGVLFGNKILAFETPETVDIDHMDDYEKAQKLISKENFKIYQYLLTHYPICKEETGHVV
ncbi:MAG: hypothetical protein A2020_02495 [Lentisphaerae bacterium GWF2_45_14]|nr:MAG: hypothetical protein A2020_02495 [Lentisphaerae bacterium GWF2_45_14]